MNARLRTMRLIWGCILASTGIYAAFLLFEVVTPTRSGELPPFAVPFAALAVGLAVMSFVIPKVIYKQLVARSNVLIVEEPVPELA